MDINTIRALEFDGGGVRSDVSFLQYIENLANTTFVNDNANITTFLGKLTA